MVELGVFVGNFSIQAVGKVVQDADAVLHRLHHPQKKNANVTLGRKLWSSTREDMEWTIISFLAPQMVLSLVQGVRDGREGAGIDMKDLSELLTQRTLGGLATDKLANRKRE